MNVPCVEWAVAERAMRDGTRSGDGFVARAVPGGFLAGVVDGLGHGDEAAIAARIGVSTLESAPQEPLVGLFGRCHARLRETRGATISVARFDALGDGMTWLGVGDVEGALFRADRAALPRRESLFLRNGVVGFVLPALRGAVVHVAPGDVLVLATDGIRRAFMETIDVTEPPQRIADTILRCHAKETDDALALVVRYTGLR